MNKIDLLKKIGIQIPNGATSFHTESTVAGSAIVFHVNDWPPHQKYFQGAWHSEQILLAIDQLEQLREHHCVGSLRFELEVSSARGYTES